MRLGQLDKFIHKNVPSNNNPSCWLVHVATSKNAHGMRNPRTKYPLSHICVPRYYTGVYVRVGVPMVLLKACRARCSFTKSTSMVQGLHKARLPSPSKRVYTTRILVSVCCQGAQRARNECPVRPMRIRTFSVSAGDLAVCQQCISNNR